MKYVAVKGADKILSKSSYIVQRPENLKNNWKEFTKLKIDSW